MSDTEEIPVINFTPDDPLVSRITLAHTLIGDLNEPGNTEEQKEMIRKAISLIFHSCFMDLSVKYPDHPVH